MIELAPIQRGTWQHRETLGHVCSALRSAIVALRPLVGECVVPAEDRPTPWTDEALEAETSVLLAVLREAAEKVGWDRGVVPQEAPWDHASDWNRQMWRDGDAARWALIRSVINSGYDPYLPDTFVYTLRAEGLLALALILRACVSALYEADAFARSGLSAT